ncbi:right-handed parallel beta-helix repeat-containing protein, partial [Patescibacteria group bacterium]|nr:right-handed parallel beta-helix repeat-containing protein [Patescibacteria group bacterium]
MFKLNKIFALSLLTLLLTLLPTVARAQVLENEILIRSNQDTLATEFVSQQNPQLIVTSSNPIKAEVNFIGEMILFSSEKTTDTEKVTLNFSGFIPATTYHFYLDEYHQHYYVESDQDGRIDFQLDTANPHTLIIQIHPSTKFIKNDTTGGDCITIGTWNYSNKTCTLTGDVFQTIQIDANNIILDGNGYSVIGNNSGNGIYSNNKQYITIKNLVVKNFANGIYFNLGSYNQVIDSEVRENEVGLRFYSSNYNQILRNIANDNRLTGIWIQKSSNNILTQNQADRNGASATAYTNDAYGIFIYDSPQNILTQNIMNDNYMNFALFSWNVAYLSQTIDQTNLVEGKPVVYLRNATNQVIDSASNAGTVYCIQCQNMTFKDLSFADEFAGVYLHQNQNSTVENISFKNGYLGVYDQYSMGNKVQDSQMENGYYGVLIVPVGGCSTGTCQYSRIENNHISNSDRGIYFNHYYVTLYGNYLEKNKVGVFAYGSNALIRNNTFTGNDLGIQFRFFDNNRMYNNNFIDNLVQTAIDNTRNPVFNLNIPTGGNYWSNWPTPNSNGDNFVDSPYELATGYFDNLPWVIPNGWLPMTTAFPVGDVGEDGWYRSDVTVTLQG